MEGRDTDHQILLPKPITMSGGAASKGALTKIYTYSRTMKSTSDYATNMKRLSNQIFGESKIKLNYHSQVMLNKIRDEPKEQSEK